MTLGALKALHDMRVDVPGQVSLIGFDDLDTGPLLRPPLTVIDRPMVEQGVLAMRLLLRRLDPQYADDIPRRIVLEHQARQPGVDGLAASTEGTIGMSPKGVLVVGSITADVTAFSRRFPRPGETVLGDDYTLVLGGKGANQAVAAAKAGAPTWIAGCVGRDPFGDLGAVGAAVTRRRGRRRSARSRAAPASRTSASTPRARTTSSSSRWPTPPSARRWPRRASQAVRAEVGVLLLQLEVPLATTCRAAKAGRAAGLTVVLDPAPAQALPDDVWPHVDVVTPNESEAGLLTGVPVTDLDSAARAAAWFLDRGVGHALITLGSGGALSVTAAGRPSLPRLSGDARRHHGGGRRLHRIPRRRPRGRARRRHRDPARHGGRGAGHHAGRGEPVAPRSAPPSRR